MKLPVIKHLTQFIEDNDRDYLIETIEVLEALTELSTINCVKCLITGNFIFLGCYNF